MTWLGSVSSYANDAYLLQVNSSFAAKSVADLKSLGHTRAARHHRGRRHQSDLLDHLARRARPQRADGARLSGRGRDLPGAAARRGRWPDQRAERAQDRSEDTLGCRALSGRCSPYRAHHAPARTCRMCRLRASSRTIPKALSLIAFAEAPFFLALPLVAPPASGGTRACAAVGLHGDGPKDRPSWPRRRSSASTEPDRRRGAVKVIAQMAATPKDVIARFNEMVAAK